MSRRSTRNKSTPTTSTAALSSTNNKLSAYEIARYQRIAENKKVMQKLGLDQTRNAMLTSGQRTTSRKRKPTTRGTRGVKTTRTKKPKLPARRSLRCQGLDSTGEKLPDDFKVLSHNGSGGSWNTTERVSERQQEEEKLKGDVELLDGDGKDFLQQLLGRSSSSSGSGSSKSGGSRKSGSSSSSSKSSDVENAAKAFANLSVDEEHGVRKVTPERIYSLAIMPDTSSVVVAAGDKKGTVGIWNVGSSQVDDGVFSIRPHSGCISHVSFSNISSNKLLTSSYDGSLKEFDSNHGVFRELLHLENKALYEFDSTPGTLLCVSL